MINWFVRRLWAGILWLMRKPFIRNLQRKSLQLVRPERREAAWQGIIRQNQWARRHGLTILSVTTKLVVASIILQIAYALVMELIESGALPSGPQPTG